MNADLQRLTIAASLVNEGRSMRVGDIRLGAEPPDVLTVTGWTRSSSLENLTRTEALAELAEIKLLFDEMVAICPNLLELAGKRWVEFCLGYDYGMGAVGVCSERNGIITWEVELKK